MGGRHLPQGYVETGGGGWSLKQATPADRLFVHGSDAYGAVC